MVESKLKGIPAHQNNLIFKFNNPVNGNSRILEMGKLKLTTKEGNILYSATSGLPGFQNLESSNKKARGRIPTCLQAKIVSYRVKTTPVYLPQVKGVNGNFYPISPFSVEVNNATRSDLGIHADRNVPGSAGCIVITLDDHWERFQVQMKILADQGIIDLPLMVF